MYTAILVLHSLLRWVVIIAALLALARAWSGWLGKKEWKSPDEKAGLIYSISLDLQVLLGLLLYIFLSPLVRGAFSDFGTAMANPVQRFWLVEHITLMLAALVLVHIGRAKAKKVGEAAAKHRASAVYYSIGTLLLLVGIPWPFLSYGRPLL